MEGTLHLDSVAKLFAISPVDQGLYVNLLLKTFFSWNGLMVIQQLCFSILFSAFTALLYVNFQNAKHPLHFSADQRKSTVDFELAIAIGIAFGLSMILPLSTVFWLGLLTAGSDTSRTLLAEFVDYVL